MFALLFSFYCLIYSGNLFNHFSSITHSPQSQKKSCGSIVSMVEPFLSEWIECFIVSVVGLMSSIITGVRLLWPVDCKNKLNQWKRDHQLRIKRSTEIWYNIQYLKIEFILWEGGGGGREGWFNRNWWCLNWNTAKNTRTPHLKEYRLFCMQAQIRN